MKRLFLITLLILSVLFSYSQDITGTWNGALKVQGISLRIVFHVDKAETGYKATMDSPDQGAKGIPMTAASFENNTLTIELSSAGIKYVSTQITADSITGTFSQMGQKFPMTLFRKAKEPEIKVRSQEPLPPFPYNSVDIVFTNEMDKIQLAGTVTYPAKKGKYPAVVLITGSGPQDRNEELLGHKPFLVLADYLTRNGFVVLRFDDRGTFKSGGDFKTATSFDFANDVKAAVKFLLSRSDVDAKNIGLIGHSEGGLIAPIVAAKDKKIKFIVMLAGPSVNGAQILLDQQMLIGKVNNMKDEDINKTYEINAEIFRLVNDIKDKDELKKQLTDFLLAKSVEFPSESIPEGTDLNKFIEMKVNEILSPWMHNFITYNPLPTLTKLKCATLALYGEKDLQVSPTLNIPPLQEMLKKNKNKKFEVVEVKSVNHLFQQCTTGSPAEYAEIDQTISPEVLKLISDWILKTTKR